LVLQAILTIVFGALAGGITNTVAIWMLFHPYEPPRLFGIRLPWLQGAIPKRKARLAAAIGRTVGTRLLTPDDLARIVREPEFRAAFDHRLTTFIRDFLEKERGSLSELLPPAAAAELRSLLSEAVAVLLSRLDTYLASEEFRVAARRWADSLAAQLRDQSLSDLLTPEREAALTEAAERWIGEVVNGPGIERAIDDYLERASERLLEPGRTFEELIPTGLVEAFERGVSGYLPLALERLGTLLDDPAARSKFEHALHEILDRFMRDLRFHQRIVASLLIPADTVQRVIQAIEEDGASKLSELLQDSAVRDAMARNVNDAVVDFLRRPVVAVLGRTDDASVVSVRRTVAEWALSLARDPQTLAFLREKLRSTLAATERRTWGDVFRHISPDRIADALVAAVRSPRARAMYRETAERMVEIGLSRPIGRPANYLPPDAGDRLQRALADPLWTWLQDQVPGLAQRLDVAGRVEQKLLDYPTRRLEELIRSVTQRELRTIVYLGYVLGGFIGVLLLVVSAITGL